MQEIHELPVNISINCLSLQVHELAVNIYISISCLNVHELALNIYISMNYSRTCAFLRYIDSLTSVPTQTDGGNTRPEQQVT